MSPLKPGNPSSPWRWKRWKRENWVYYWVSKRRKWCVPVKWFISEILWKGQQRNKWQKHGESLSWQSYFTNGNQKLRAHCDSLTVTPSGTSFKHSHKMFRSYSSLCLFLSLFFYWHLVVKIQNAALNQFPLLHYSCFLFRIYVNANVLTCFCHTWNYKETKS